jgi:hydrogenase maturation factor
MSNILPVGKLPTDLLARLIGAQPVMHDPQVIIGPGIGLDCAVIEAGSKLLVYKSDPITFAADSIGWYLVHVNANDIVTTGAVPRWLLIAMLFPEGQTTPEIAERTIIQVYDACREIGVTVVGGHTEITTGLDRPILLGTMVGEVEWERLVTPRGLRDGDRILLTKGVPIEATAILAREFPDRLANVVSPQELEQARAFLVEPGISVLRDARTALQAGEVTAMHDVTEGGLLLALWELAIASDHSLYVDLTKVHVPPLSARICQAFGLNPLATIASGALLLGVRAADVASICHALETEGVACIEIGRVSAGPASVWHKAEQGYERLVRPDRDEIAKVYENGEAAPNG